MEVIKHDPNPNCKDDININCYAIKLHPTSQGHNYVKVTVNLRGCP